MYSLIMSLTAMYTHILIEKKKMDSRNENRKKHPRITR